MFPGSFVPAASHMNRHIQSAAAVGKEQPLLLRLWGDQTHPQRRWCQGCAATQHPRRRLRDSQRPRRSQSQTPGTLRSGRSRRPPPARRGARGETPAAPISRCCLRRWRERMSATTPPSAPRRVVALDSCPAELVRRDILGGQHTADFHRCSRPKSCFTAKRGVDLQRCQPAGSNASPQSSMQPSRCWEQT